MNDAVEELLNASDTIEQLRARQRNLAVGHAIEVGRLLAENRRLADALARVTHGFEAGSVTGRCTWCGADEDFSRHWTPERVRGEGAAGSSGDVTGVGT